jgi:hypothetical protein
VWCRYFMVMRHWFASYYLRTAVWGTSTGITISLKLSVTYCRQFILFFITANNLWKHLRTVVRSAWSSLIGTFRQFVVELQPTAGWLLIPEFDRLFHFFLFVASVIFGLILVVLLPSDMREACYDTVQFI